MAEVESRSGRKEERRKERGGEHIRKRRGGEHKGKRRGEQERARGGGEGDFHHHLSPNS